MKYIHSCLLLMIGVAGLLAGCERHSDEPRSASYALEHGLLPTFAIKGEALPHMTLTERMKYYNVPGVSIAVIDNRSLAWAQGYGIVEVGSSQPVTVDTLFQGASISKLVTAMIVLSSAQSGDLGLDDDVNAALQSWKIPANHYTQEEKITLRELLSHSAGVTVGEFHGYAVDEELPTLLQILDGQKPANSEAIRVDTLPGSVWRYSGGGYVIVQQLLEDITGKSFPEIAQERIFENLDMKHSTFAQPLSQSLTNSAATGHWTDGYAVKGKWYTYPEMAAAGLWTTPSDLARLAIELQQAKDGRSQKVLSAEMANTMLTPQISNSGLGVFLRDNGTVTWLISGGSNMGFRCFMTIFMETGQGAIVMTNSDNGHYLAMEIIRGLAHIYDWPDFRVQEKIVAKLDPRVYEDYEGDYEFIMPSGAGIVIARKGQHLATELLGRTIDFYPETETRYFELESGMVLSFVKDAEGHVNELILERPLSPQQWKANRTR